MGLFSKKPSNSVSNDTAEDTSQGDSPIPSQADVHQPSRTQVEQRPAVKKHSRAFSFVSILFLLTILGAGVMTYLWYNQRLDNDSLNSELSQTRAEVSTLKQQVQPAGGKDFVEESKLAGLAESYHQANVTEGYQDAPYVVTIKYLDKDYNFARVHIEYLAADQNLPKGTRTGKFEHYIFKSVMKKNGEKEWVMLGKNPVLEAERVELRDTYGVPLDVMDLTKEQPA